MTIAFATSVKRIIDMAGQSVVYTSKGAITRNADLSRTSTDTNYTLKCHMRKSKDSHMQGNVSDNIRDCRIAAKGLVFIPKRGDSLDDGVNIFSVSDVDSRQHAGVILEYILKVRGNAKV